MKWDYCMTIDYATKNGRPFVQKKKIDKWILISGMNRHKCVYVKNLPHFFSL